MLYDSDTIDSKIGNIIEKISMCQPGRVEVGLINLAKTGSVILDKSLNLGWKAYAKVESKEFNVTVHFSEAFNSYAKLRRGLLQRGMEVTRGRYDFYMDVPENAK